MKNYPHLEQMINDRLENFLKPEIIVQTKILNHAMIERKNPAYRHTIANHTECLKKLQDEFDELTSAKIMMDRLSSFNLPLDFEKPETTVSNDRIFVGTKIDFDL